MTYGGYGGFLDLGSPYDLENHHHSGVHSWPFWSAGNLPNILVDYHTTISGGCISPEFVVYPWILLVESQFWPTVDSCIPIDAQTLKSRCSCMFKLQSILGGPHQIWFQWWCWIHAAWWSWWPWLILVKPLDPWKTSSVLSSTCGMISKAASHKEQSLAALGESWDFCWANLWWWKITIEIIWNNRI